MQHGKVATHSRCFLLLVRFGLMRFGFTPLGMSIFVS
jgi:hypothetical protein